MEEYRSTHRFARISARKARLVIDTVRGKKVNDALVSLQSLTKRAAPMIKKVLHSAMSNAVNQNLQDEKRIDVNRLLITQAWVDEGPTMKRWRARARGRAMRIRKRTCHIHVIVGLPEEVVQESQAKAVEKEKK